MVSVAALATFFADLYGALTARLYFCGIAFQLLNSHLDLFIGVAWVRVAASSSPPVWKSRTRQTRQTIERPVEYLTSAGTTPVYEVYILRDSKDKTLRRA